MKINKAKLLVGTLAVAAVAATVGSISGTVAWFQYSTRVTAAYSGAAAHVSENLQIRLYKLVSEAQGTEGQQGYVPAVEHKTEWKSDLSISDIRGYIASERGAEDYKLRPITSGNALAEGGVADSFYKSPIYQYSGIYGAQNAWKAADVLDYVELPIELRVLDRNGANTDEFLAKKVYLSDLTVASKDVEGKKDITDALRVSFDLGAAEGAAKVTFSKKGETVATSGNLDLNGDGAIDLEEGYEWDDRDPFVYGGTLGGTNSDEFQDSQEVTTKIRDAQTAATAADYLADDSNPEAIVGKELGTTPTDGSGLQVKVRIYLEGWQLLEDDGIINAAIEKSGDADLAALQADTSFSPENGKTYKTADGKIYKWTAGEAPAAGSYSEVDPRSAIWNDDAYAEAEFNVGMRFSAQTHADH